MTKTKRMIFIFIPILVLIMAGIIFFISRHQQSTEHKTRQQTSTLTLSKMDLIHSISATGTIESMSTKSVSTNANAMTVKEVCVEAGDTVAAGDILAVLDGSTLEETLTDAKETLSDTTDDADSQIADAKTTLTEAKEVYQTEKKKQAQKVSDAKAAYTEAKSEVSALKKRLAASTDTTQTTVLNEQLQKAEETLSQTKSAYEQAKETRDQTNKQNTTSITNAEKQLEQAKKSREKALKEANKQISQAEAALDACTVTAPMAGMVTAVNVDAGDTYSGGAMFQIDDVSGFTVSTSVDEYDISSLAVGQRVVILTEATEATELEGEITFISPAAASTQGMNGTTASSGYEVEIAIHTKDARLRIGMTAKCSIVLEEATDVFAVPYDAIHEDADGSYISVPGKKIYITKGLESDYYVEISGASLSEGLQVILPTDEISVSEDNTEASTFPFGRDDKGFSGGDMPEGMPSGGGPSGGGMPSGNEPQ